MDLWLCQSLNFWYLKASFFLRLKAIFFENLCRVYGLAVIGSVLCSNIEHLSNIDVMCIEICYFQKKNSLVHNTKPEHFLYLKNINNQGVAPSLEVSFLNFTFLTPHSLNFK